VNQVNNHTSSVNQVRVDLSNLKLAIVSFPLGGTSAPSLQILAPSSTDLDHSKVTFHADVDLLPCKNPTAAFDAATKRPKASCGRSASTPPTPSPAWAAWPASGWRSTVRPGPVLC